MSCLILDFDKCNQKCLFCMRAKDIENRHRLSYQAVAQEIINARNKGYKNVDFFGGEPTCFPFLKKAIQLANNLGLTVTLATNALKFSSRRYADIFFQGIDIEGMRTSLHSYKPEVHEAITQVAGSFDKTIKGIAHILKHNKRLSVNIVITAWNHKDIVNMPAYVHKLGVKAIKFSGLILRGRALKNRKLDIGTASFLPALLEALEAARKLGFYYIEVEKLPREIFQGKKLGFVHFLTNASPKDVQAY